MFETMLDLGKIIIADIVLSGDNALVIAMAASGLAPELRRKAIIIGMVMAAVLTNRVRIHCNQFARCARAAVHRIATLALGVLRTL